MNELGVAEKLMLVDADRPEFGDAALDALRGWRFAPATSEVGPVDALLIVPLSFKIQSRLDGTPKYKPPEPFR